MSHFDVFVIGTGPSGSRVARFLAAEGKKVGIVDELPYGGTCALRGCNPKKVMVTASEILDTYNRMQQTLTNETQKAHLDWKKLVKHAGTFTASVTESRHRRYQKLGITMYHGTATFKDANTLQIGDDTVTADKIVIATGTKPRPLDIQGGDLVVTSRDFFTLPEMPNKVVMIGAGYITMEFAHIIRETGAEVTILHRSDQILKQFDKDLVQMLMESYEQMGIKILLNHDVDKIEKTDSAYKVYSGDKSFQAGLVFNGAGRIPNYQGLDLDAAGVEYDERGIPVNACLQTNIENIYVTGDISHLRPEKLSPMAGYQAKWLVKNLLEDVQEPFTVYHAPSAAFTSPPIASVGLSEAEALQKYSDLEVKFTDASNFSVSKWTGVRKSAFKLLINDGYIVGAHLLGYHVEEVINTLAFAINYKIPVDEVREFMYVFPSMSANIEDMLM